MCKLQFCHPEHLVPVYHDNKYMGFLYLVNKKLSLHAYFKKEKLLDWYDWLDLVVNNSYAFIRGKIK